MVPFCLTFPSGKNEASPKAEAVVSGCFKMKRPIHSSKRLTIHCSLAHAFCGVTMKLALTRSQLLEKNPVNKK